MKFKPFYIKYAESMSDQDVADVFDKAVSKGANLYEGVYGFHDINSVHKSSYYTYFGVAQGFSTYFGHSPISYGYKAVELTLDQVDAHLGIINIKEVPTLVPHIHAKEIKAWADGHEIEYSLQKKLWHNATKPRWDITINYRIKPKKEVLDLEDELKRLDWQRMEISHKLEELRKG